MADTPRQVNAAQAARRKILATKSRRKVDSDRDDHSLANSVPLFAPMPTGQAGGGNIFGNGGSGGGLFGGSVQASGSFNFSAPSITQMPSYSFPPSTFNSGPSSPSIWGANSMGTDGSSNNNSEDPRADTTGEEAARRHKPFRMMGAAETSQPQASAQAFSNPFQQQLAPTQATSDAAKSNPFQFGNANTASSTVSSSPFNFGTSTKTQEQSSSNLFGGFNSQNQNQQTPSSGTGFTFGTPPPQEKPATNTFSFGQTQAPQPASTTQSFGSIPAPTTNLFHQPASTGSSFGSIPAPTTSLFNFGQTSAKSQPPTTNSLFSSTPTSVKASSNPWGQTTAEVANPTNIFGQLNSQPTPTPNIFSKSSSPAPTTNGIFATQSQETPSSSAPSLFGNQSQTPASTNNLFSSLGGESTTGNIFANLAQPGRSESPSRVFDKEAKENTPPTTNMFGAPTPPATSGPTENAGPASSIFGTPKSSTNLFAAQQPAAGSNIFGNKADASPSNNLFGTPKTQSAASANPFATLNRPAPQSMNGNSPAITSAALDTVPATSAPPSSPRPAPASLQTSQIAKPPVASPFSFGPVTNGFSPIKQPDSVLPSVEGDDSDREKSGTASLFKSSGEPSTSNLFSSMKPVDAPEAAAQPAPRGMFPTLSQPVQSNSNNVFSQSIGSYPLKAVTNGDDSEQTSGINLYFAEIGPAADSVIEAEVPPSFNEEQRLQFFAAYRTRALNKALKAIVDSGDFTRNYEPVLQHYKRRRDDINNECDAGLRNLKRRRGEVIDDEDSTSPAKRSKPSTNSGQGQYAVQTPQKPLSSSNGNASPEKRTDSRTTQSPAKSQPFLNGSTTPKAPPPTPKLFAPQSAPPASPSPRGKRKAEVQITQLDPDGEAATKQSQKLPKLNGGTGGSETSNIFKNILDKPAELPASNSPKKVFSLTKASSDEPTVPRSNPFASLSMPAGSGTSTLPAANANPFGSSSTPLVTPSTSPSKPATPSTNMFSKPASTPAPTPVTATSNPFASKTGSTPSSLFSMPATNTPSFFGSKPSTAPVVSSPLAKGPSTADDLAAKNASTGASTFKSPMFGSASTSTPTSAPSVKPPTFGAPVNFLAQFGKKATKSAAEREREDMEKAKMEDMDSDEDEAEWEAAYKEKRKASREELKRIAETGPRFSVSDTSGSETEKPKSTPKSLFGQPAPKSAAKSAFGQSTTTSAPSSSLFLPVPRSGASSPGLISSNGSSVFDGLAPNKPVTFGDNIFGHLSDVDSGADSGKGNDADDDTDESQSEAEDEEEHEEPDDEAKDATYDPRTSEPALPGTPGTPTTPVEETGEGIASTKKLKVPFSFGGAASNSGTSSPGGSLFDRITRGADGNPVRQLPTEDKENAGPGTSSIFGSNAASTGSLFNFSKSPAQDPTKSPSGDNTWKPDTPIKFGTSTAAPAFTFGSSPSTPPAVNVQAPTPTKTNPFGNLFGSTNPPKSTVSASGSGAVSPFAGLFGNSAAPKPSSPSIFSNLGNQDKPAAVGFNFGGPSTATSSLFPSVAGSAGTSRATTPGGTTDGESANEANGGADEAPLAQIDLASGGAGEENEDKVFEVRAKAQKFEAAKKESGAAAAWVVKGLGIFRILKHKETGKSRMLMRAEPSGTVVLNRRILPTSYSATQKTVKLLVSDDTGKGMETWLLQVKTPESAKELAEALEKNKTSV